MEKFFIFIAIGAFVAGLILGRVYSLKEPINVILKHSVECAPIDSGIQGY